MKQILTESFLKKLGVLVYEEILYKLAEEYVKKTDNIYDDAALKFLSDMLVDLKK
jgi:hypothetical protein